MKGATYLSLIWFSFLFLDSSSLVYGVEVYPWEEVPCNEYVFPDNCDFERIPRLTVEDYDRCAPAVLPLNVRNYYLSRSGRGWTYRDNFESFKRVKILPKVLRDVTGNSLDISTLGQRLDFPIGISPAAYHTWANPEGEKATAAAATSMGTIMVLSCFSMITLEEVAAYVKGFPGQLWMQTYIFQNRSRTIDLVERAERNGFKAVMLTCDSPFIASDFCDAKPFNKKSNEEVVNMGELSKNLHVIPATFSDIRWLKTITKMPVIAKGILRGDDAQQVILAGASAILVSNHGGRQLDGALASIDALPGVVKAVKEMNPHIDVYLDSGIRNGFDVYKAIARGAKMVFVGRPALWGLTLGGEDGVKDVLNILKTEFNESMILAGASNPSKILEDSVS